MTGRARLLIEIATNSDNSGGGGFKFVRTDTGEDPVVTAERIYTHANDHHREWWSGYESDDIDAVAEQIFDKICDVYKVDPESIVADLIYAHVFASRPT